METISGILATSYPGVGDAVGGTDALQTMVEQINSHYYPIEFEYDPRQPHQGRWIHASVITLDDDGYAVEAQGEIFESGDDPDLDTSTRLYPLPTFSPGKLQISLDQHFYIPDAKSIIADLEVLAGTPVKKQVRKYARPIRVLALGTALGDAPFASGFSAAVPAEQEPRLQESLSCLLQIPMTGVHEQLLKIEFLLQSRNEQKSATLLLEQPTPETLRQFFREGPRLCADLVDRHLMQSSNRRRLVMDFNHGAPRVLFAVRRDAWIERET